MSFYFTFFYLNTFSFKGFKRNSPEGYTLDLKGHNKESQSTHCLKKFLQESVKNKHVQKRAHTSKLGLAHIDSMKVCFCH